MKTFQLDCASCGAQLSIPLSEAFVHAPCPLCRTDVWVSAFPALVQEMAQGRSGESVLVDGESTCFHHPAKKAVVPCDSCGRFLCSLCDVEMNGQHLCPGCIETGVKKGKLTRLKREHFYYDELALVVAVAPLLIFYITIITAPIALYLCMRHWKKPLSAAPRGRWRFAVAAILASLQLVGWGCVVLYVVSRLTR